MKSTGAVGNSENEVTRREVIACSALSSPRGSSFDMNWSVSDALCGSSRWPSA